MQPIHLFPFYFLDGGFGWVVVAASFFCCLIVDGIVMSAGAFLTPIADDFGVSSSQVSQNQKKKFIILFTPNDQ